MKTKRKGGHPLTDENVFSPPTALEERQALLAHHVRMVARGLSFGLFVAGQHGVGKSKIISETLADEGIAPVLANSHVTPLALYALLFNNRQGRVIWLDDCDGLYGNMAALGLLRSALWESNGSRTVTYLSSQLDGLPPSFEFGSRIIFTANSIPKRNAAFLAVLSRVDVFELTASNDEVLDVMRAMAAKGYGSLPPAVCLDVVNFIARAGGSRQLSLRLFHSAMTKVEYAMTAGGDADWRDLVKTQLDQLGTPQDTPRPLDGKGHDQRCMAIAIEKYPKSAQEQEECWREMTGKSRASFFRAKKEYSSLHGVAES